MVGLVIVGFGGCGCGFACGSGFITPPDTIKSSIGAKIT